MPFLASLFLKRASVSTNMWECTEDFYRELYELFEIARSWYLQAEKNHMKTEYFIELFERSHQYIDCDWVHVVRTRDRWQLALLVLCLETLSVCQ